MRTPDEVSAMLALRARGWGSKRIARELGCSRNTVRRLLSDGGWRAVAPVVRRRALDELEDWLAERFRRHAGNADLVRQELLAARGVAVSLRTDERAVAPLRQALRAEARAPVRFGSFPPAGSWRTARPREAANARLPGGQLPQRRLGLHVVPTRTLGLGGPRLRDWARAIAERTGPRKAKAALARKLAVILHAIWRSNTPFQEAAMA